jgi:phosphatidylserine/phosphatidylglycerophosphate/cardiolipin synthase-like enzyme
MGSLTRTSAAVPPIVLALVVLAGVAVPASANAPIQVWFGPHAPGSSEGLDAHFIRFVDGARATLDCAFYELRLDSIAGALAGAKKRGVKVRFLVDDANYYGKTESGTINKRKKNPFIQQLIRAGIPVKTDADRRSLMHHKFAVADGQRVWTGSYNLTDTCSYNNANNAMRLEGKAIGAVFTRQFEEMYTKQLFGPRRPSTVADQTVDVGDQKVEVLFAPEDDPMARQIEILRSAKSAILFMQFAFTADSVSDVLVQKATQEKLPVKGIMDHRLYRSTGPYSEFSKLMAAGVPVVVYSKPDGKFHHKVFIVDPGTPNACVITGSENTSNNGNEANDENVLILRDRTTVERFSAAFNSLYGRTSKTQADLVYGEAPVAGESISSAELFIYANGRPVQDLQVEFPPRWPLPEETVRKAEIQVGGQKIEPSRVEIRKNKVIVRGVGLEVSGKNSMIVIRMSDLPIPEIPGKYSPLVAVTSPGETKFTPLAIQPVITVYDGKSTEAVAAQFDHLRGLFHKLARVENMPGTDVAKLKLAWEKDFDRLRRTILRAASAGRWAPVTAVLDYLDSFDREELVAFAQITDNARELRRVLTDRARTVPEARGLLDRLDAIAARRGGA